MNIVEWKTRCLHEVFIYLTQWLDRIIWKKSNIFFLLVVGYFFSFIWISHNFVLLTVITYKVQVVIGNQIGSATSANCWLNLAGKSDNTGTVHLPKGDLEFRFRVRINLKIRIRIFIFILIIKILLCESVDDQLSLTPL